MPSAAANELLSGTGAFTQENLEKIASGLGGMTTALEGSKTYYADNGDAYHLSTFRCGSLICLYHLR